MRTVFSKVRARVPVRRRRRRLWAEPILALAAVAVLGWVVIEGGHVDVPGLPAITATPTLETVSARFSLCAGPGGTCVVDGDTIRIEGQPVRIADIDTPEVRGYSCPEEKALGDRATLRMLELVNQGPFTMRLYDHRDEDRYGRKLRVLARDGQSLGMILVDEGLARPWNGARRSWC